MELPTNNQATIRTSNRRRVSVRSVSDICAIEQQHVHEMCPELFAQNKCVWMFEHKHTHTTFVTNTVGVDDTFVIDPFVFTMSFNSPLNTAIIFVL